MGRYTKYSLPNRIVYTFGLIFFLLSGCAVTPDNWSFTKEVIKTDQLDQIKRIALLDVPPPGNIQLGPMLSEDAMWWLGPIGAMTIENTGGNEIISSAQVAETTQRELKNWLEQAGVEVVLIKADRTKESKMLKNYSAFSQVDADAILEVAPINIGYVDNLRQFKFDFCAFPPCDSKKQLSPDVLFKYRLVSAKSGEILVESNVSYSSFFNYSGVGINLVGPKEHVFRDKEAVKKQPEEALRRLSFSIKEATKLISAIVTNTERDLPDMKSRAIGNWTGEIESSGHNTYTTSITIFDKKTAQYQAASGAKGTIQFYSTSDQGRWEGYWIGTRPAKICVEEKEGSRNWGVVVWQFDAAYPSFKGTWDYCGEGRKYSWSGHR